MGIFWALISTVFSTAKDVVSKKLSYDVDGTVSSFASFIYALPYYFVLLLVLWLSGQETFEVAPTFFIWIVLRSLTDTCAEWLKMHALAHGDLSVVTSLFSLYPLMLLFTSPIITGDQLSIQGGTGVLLTIAGTILILFEPFKSNSRMHYKGILFALGSAFFFSLNSCFDRLAVQSASPALSGFVMTFLAGLFLLPLMLRKKERFAVMANYHKPFLQRGFFEISFMVSKLYALQFLQAPYVVAIQRVSVILSIISGRLIFKEKHFMIRLAAGLLICFGVYLIVLQNS